MRNKTKSLKYNFVKIRGQQFMLLLIIGVVKTGVWAPKGFRSEKKHFAVFEKTKVVSITCRLRKILGQSLREIDFSTRSAPEHF